MKKNYELVIFDLDGTLLDTAPGILPAIAESLDFLDIPHAEIKAHEFIGPPIEKALAKQLFLKEPLLTAASREFRKRYKSEHLLKAAPYRGIDTLLIALRQMGYGRAVATYKRTSAAEQLLWHCGLSKHLDLIHGTTDEYPMTKAELILRCIEDYGLCDRAHAVMVGDTAEDADGAAAAGIDFIAVTYGFGFTEGMVLNGISPIGIARAPAEILSLIKDELTPHQGRPDSVFPR